MIKTTNSYNTTLSVSSCVSNLTQQNSSITSFSPCFRSHKENSVHYKNCIILISLLLLFGKLYMSATALVGVCLYLSCSSLCLYLSQEITAHLNYI